MKKKETIWKSLVMNNFERKKKDLLQNFHNTKLHI